MPSALPLGTSISAVTVLLRPQVIPIFQDVRRPRLELGVLQDHAQTLLILEDLVAQLVPAFVEEMHRTDLVDPFLGRVMRRMSGSRRVLNRKRLVRNCLIDAVQLVDRVVGHSGDEIPSRLSFRRIDLRRIAKKIRLPLISIAAYESVEIFKTHADRPLVKRADLAGGERRRVVVLAKPGRGVSVVEKDAANRGLVLANDAVVTRKSGGLFRDYTETAE